MADFKAKFEWVWVLNTFFYQRNCHLARNIGNALIILLLESIKSFAPLALCWESQHLLLLMLDRLFLLFSSVLFALSPFLIVPPFILKDWFEFSHNSDSNSINLSETGASASHNFLTLKSRVYLTMSGNWTIHVQKSWWC